MKILVGTLYTIENEFDECLESINQQTYQNYQHLIIKNQPKKEAHDKLYSTFLNRSNEFDLFIKIDADMVLTGRKIFTQIVKEFKNEPELGHLEIAVHDFFAEDLIWGLHAYRNYDFETNTQEELFTDRFRSQNYKVKDSNQIAPAAIHCKNPSRFQSFHYGVHRGMKAVNKPNNKKSKSTLMHYIRLLKRKLFAKGKRCFWCEQKNPHSRVLTGKWDLYDAIKNRVGETADVRILDAMVGFEMGMASYFLPHHVDYNNGRLKSEFNEVKEMSKSELLEKINQINHNNYGYLPRSLRKLVLSRR